MNLSIAFLLIAQLLQPTGTSPIGRVTFTWTDPARHSRPVRVHLFYPARDVSDARRAPYHPDLSFIEQYTNEHFGKDYLRNDFGSSYESLMKLEGHAYEGAKAAQSPRAFPIVVFSHGGGIQVLYYSTLLEELASHGYVVAAVEHPEDEELVVLPDGAVIEQKGWEDDAKRTPAQRAEFHRQRHEVDAADNSFVLDQLARVNAGKITSPLRGRLDLKRISAAGHSLGGMSSVFSCARDSRFYACVNLDGGLDAGEQYPPVKQPLLAIFGGPPPVKLPIESDENFAKRQARNATFLESKGHKDLLSQYANVTSRSAMVYVNSPGFSHFSYYDLVRPEAEQWADTPERAARNLTIIRATMLAFLDATLKRGESDAVPALRKVDAPLTIVPINSAP